MARSSDNSSEKFDESFLYLDELAQLNTEKNSSRSTIDTEEDVDVSVGESGIEDQVSGSSGSDDDDRGIKITPWLLFRHRISLHFRYTSGMHGIKSFLLLIFLPVTFV